MKKPILLFCLTICVIMSCCACGEKRISEGSVEAIPEDSEIQAAPARPVTDTPYIGMVLKSTDNPYFALLKAGAEAEADRLGVQVMVVSPETEANTQEQEELLETMADMAVDVIIISPSDEACLTNALQKAEENDKIIISVDTALEYAGCSCYIGTDQYAAGYVQGKYAAELAKDASHADAVILRGSQNDSVHHLREAGLKAGLTDGMAEVRAVMDCSCDAKKAEETMTALLEQLEEVNIVCTTSDSMAAGAQRAIAAAGRNDIHIVSFDGLLQACELICKGDIDAAIAQDPYHMGECSIRAAMDLYSHQSTEKEILIDTKLITAENVKMQMEKIEEEMRNSR